VREVVSGRLGALVEREYRLLFSATVVTSLGDAIASIALAFAVLAAGSATDLGIVFAARQGANAAVLLFGGVLSDRLPRSRMLVGASLVQGVAQGRPPPLSCPDGRRSTSSPRWLRCTGSEMGW
jgi:MFS family permease